MLPVKFRQGQRGYFGKRRMTLHVVFFGKKDSQARKKVYLTAMYISDQATKDVKNIADSIHDYLSLKNH